MNLPIKPLLFSTMKQFVWLLPFLMLVLGIISILYIIIKHAQIPGTLRWFKIGLGILAGPIVILCSYVMAYTIEKFLHYQRIREVIYVLELAYFVSRKNAHLLEGLHLSQENNTTGSS